MLVVRLLHMHDVYMLSYCSSLNHGSRLNLARSEHLK